MDVKKQLWSITRMVLPAVGFALTGIGAYLVSLQTDYDFSLEMIPIYIMIAFGFLTMTIGVFWSLCHSMKSKVYQRRHHEQQIQIFTLDRSSSFPPSYEESQRGQVCPDGLHEVVVSADAVGMVMSLAPPLYSRDSSEAPNCMWSWEQPPQYSQAVQTQPGQTYAGDQREASSAD